MCQKWFNDAGQETNLQFVTPRITRREVLTSAHDNRLSGHMGDAKTLERVRYMFYWLGMRDDITHRLRSCDREPKPSRLHHFLDRQVVSEPNERVAMHIMGQFDHPRSRVAHILVISDYLTKWVEVFPMPEKTAERCPDLFVREWVLCLGTRLELLTDQDMQFESKLFQVCRLLNTNKLRTSTSYPYRQTGQIEQSNKTILDLLNKLQVYVPRNWTCGCRLQRQFTAAQYMPLRSTFLIV